MLNKKVFIFDFDGTFYSGKNVFSKLAEHVNNGKRSILKNISDSDYNKIMSENPEWKTTINGTKIVDLLYSFKQKYPHLNISANDFWKWQQQNPDPIIIDPNETVDPTFMKNLCESYPVYIVSNSSPNHIHLHMKTLKLNPKWFKEIISNKFTIKDRTKKHYYARILEKEKCSPENAFVFGDSLSSDLEPAIALGIKAFAVTNAKLLPNLVNQAIDN